MYIWFSSNYWLHDLLQYLQQPQGYKPFGDRMMTPQVTIAFYTTTNTNANVQLIIIQNNSYPSSWKTLISVKSVIFKLKVKKSYLK